MRHWRTARTRSLGGGGIVPYDQPSIVDPGDQGRTGVGNVDGGVDRAVSRPQKSAILSRADVVSDDPTGVVNPGRVGGSNTRRIVDPSISRAIRGSQEPVAAGTKSAVPDDLTGVVDPVRGCVRMLKGTCMVV